MLARLVAALGAPVLLIGATPVSASPTQDRPTDPPAQHSVQRAVADAAPPRSPGQALFNDPFGTKRQQFALIRHINRAIDGAGRRSVVRVAAFSFAMPATAQALIRAHRRGAAVKLVVDDRSATWGSVRNLRRQLGANIHRRSFVRVCHGSCRGGSGNQHAKFVTISGTRRAEHVVMVGSMNFTTFAAARQWQDLYSVADADLYAQYERVFRQMKRDRPQKGLSLPALAHGMRVEVEPRVATPPDPVAVRLAAVRCRGVDRRAGDRGHTLLRISMHAWNGERGVRLARKVAHLRRTGCDVRVVGGVGVGRRVATILRRAGVDYRAGDRDGRATHEKVMFVSGRYGASDNASFVWTGSHNFTDRSLRNDEVTLRVAGARQVAAYRANFDRIWASAERRKPE
jgi:phosphatidylserine/phosphatidylglycerophosphate/cardiolipin synthase-like enzyme